MDFALRPVLFENMPGWQADDPQPLFEMMGRCHDHITRIKPYRIGSSGVDPMALASIFAEAKQHAAASGAEARAFFEERFQPCRIETADGKAGFVTGFYEPEVEVSDRPDALWCHPFYRRPEDLIDLDETNRPPDMDASVVFAQKLPDGRIADFPDRRAIDEGYLDHQGLEIAWAKSRVDVFFAHIQGAARLRYRDGTMRRITYAAKSGHAFSAIGRHLVDQGEISPADISMGSIRAWLAEHPDQVSAVLWKNRSYIFFRQARVASDDLGPVAAAKVALVAGRSLAVDRLVHTFSTPFFVYSESLRHLDAGKPFARLMMALDTGSAIVGPSRGDIFTGSGEMAGDLAGNIRNDADFYTLIPKTQAASLL